MAAKNENPFTNTRLMLAGLVVGVIGVILAFTYTQNVINKTVGDEVYAYYLVEDRPPEWNSDPRMSAKIKYAETSTKKCRRSSSTTREKIMINSCRSSRARLHAISTKENHSWSRRSIFLSPVRLLLTA